MDQLLPARGQKTRKYHVFVAVQTQLKSNQGMVAF